MKTTIWYSLSDGQDGSAGVTFYESEALADLAAEMEFERFGQGFSESTGAFTIEHKGPITVSGLETRESMLKEAIEEAAESWAEDIDHLMVKKLQELKT